MASGLFQAGSATLIDSDVGATRPAYQPRYKLLLTCLLAVLLAYSGLYPVEEMLSRRDYSSIVNVEMRVGYCMATSLSSYEKHTFAQSIARPSSNELYSTVLSYALAGEVIAQKLGAIRALRERDELRRRATQIALRLADDCGYDQSGLPAHVSPWGITERWLDHDDGFSFFLNRAKQSAPDEAEQAYRLVLRKAGNPALRKN